MGQDRTLGGPESGALLAISPRLPREVYRWAIRSARPNQRGGAHDGRILAWFDCRIANGLIESINGLIRAAKSRARWPGRQMHRGASDMGSLLGRSPNFRGAAHHPQTLNAPIPRKFFKVSRLIVGKNRRAPSLRCRKPRWLFLLDKICGRAQGTPGPRSSETNQPIDTGYGQLP